MNKKLKLFIAILIAVFIQSTISFAQKKPDFGSGIRFTAKDTSFTCKFNMRFQSLYVYNYDQASESGSSQFLVRRARLKFGGYVFSKNLEYKTEFGLSNRDISVNSEDGNTREAARVILDAVLKWKFSKNWSLWIGQTKLPGNRERVISSANLQLVDRSLVNSRFNIDRDAGIQLRGKYTLGNVVLAPGFAISQGEGRNITSLNFGGYDYTFHLDFLPFGAFKDKGDYVSADLSREPTPKLAIGLTYDYNDGAVRQGGQLGRFVRNEDGDYAENSLSTFMADLMFKYQGFSVLSEYADKKGDMQIDDLSSNFRTGSGFTIQAGYLTPSNFEFALRYTTIRQDDEVYSGIRDEDQFTLGLSKYIVGHSLKVQSDVSRTTFPGQDDGRFQFRMQVEMQF